MSGISAGQERVLVSMSKKIGRLNEIINKILQKELKSPVPYMKLKPKIVELLETLPEFNDAPGLNTPEGKQNLIKFLRTNEGKEMVSTIISDMKGTSSVSSKSTTETDKESMKTTETEVQLSERLNLPIPIIRGLSAQQRMSLLKGKMQADTKFKRAIPSEIDSNLMQLINTELMQQKNTTQAEIDAHHNSNFDANQNVNPIPDDPNAGLDTQAVENTEGRDETNELFLDAVSNLYNDTSSEFVQEPTLQTPNYPTRSFDQPDTLPFRRPFGQPGPPVMLGSPRTAGPVLLSSRPVTTTGQPGTYAVLNNGQRFINESFEQQMIRLTQELVNIDLNTVAGKKYLAQKLAVHNNILRDIAASEKAMRHPRQAQFIKESIKAEQQRYATGFPVKVSGANI